MSRQDYFILTSADEFIREEFRKVIQEQFNYTPYRVGKEIDLRVTSKVIRAYLASLGLGYDLAHEKKVPHTILCAPKSVVRAFLQGLFDTDGHAATHYGKVSLSTSSPRLAHEVHLLLLNFGIISSLRIKKTPCRDHFIVSIEGEDSISFYQDIGFRLPRKQARFALVSATRRPNKGGIPHLEAPLRSLQIQLARRKNSPLSLQSVKSLSYIFSTYIPNRRNLSYAKLDSLIDYCQFNNVGCEEFLEIQTHRFFYDRVVETSPGTADVFDLSVPGTHSYVANGFVSHNSTYLRQCALVAVMAQIGSFVPADEARLCLLDRIFTRVGASDNLASGRSTFMVEMTETANILNTATPRSLVILDEVGRGTATFDGLSLAWAIAEYLHDNTLHAAKTLFATHYHEMTELEKLLPGVRNYQMAVKESEGSIVFLRKVVEGTASKSYGIDVARLAGLPRPVVERAREILTNLEANELDVMGRPKLARHLPSRKNSAQPTLFESANEAVIDELRNLEPVDLSPDEAREVLRKLRERVM